MSSFPIFNHNPHLTFTTFPIPQKPWCSSTSPLTFFPNLTIILLSSPTPQGLILLPHLTAVTFSWQLSKVEDFQRRNTFHIMVIIATRCYSHGMQWVFSIFHLLQHRGYLQNHFDISRCTVIGKVFHRILPRNIFLLWLERITRQELFLAQWLSAQISEFFWGHNHIRKDISSQASQNDVWHTCKDEHDLPKCYVKHELGSYIAHSVNVFMTLQAEWTWRHLVWKVCCCILVT